jgi:hypothetical protein
LEGGPPTFRQGFSCPALLKDMDPGFPYGAVTRSGPPFQALPVPKTHATGLVRVRSPLLTESRLMSFPPATEMFQFAGFASLAYGFSQGYPLRGGLPHSETPGSPIARISPGLFAACYVLHRLSVPRHPPDALLMRLPTPNGKDHRAARHCANNAAKLNDAPAQAGAHHIGAANSLSPVEPSFHRLKTRQVERIQQPNRPPGPLHAVTQLASLRLSSTGPPAPARDPGGNLVFMPRRLRLGAASTPDDLPLRVAPVEVIGLEPTTPCLQSRCSPS